jgi:2-dehydropantoate 2-reductase
MRYVIYGAGGIGGTIGARLHQAGFDVVLIARGAHFEAMSRNGLRFRCPGGTFSLDIPVVSHPRDADLSTDDIIMMTMKSQHMLPALNELAALGAHSVPIVCCQNGVSNEFEALRRFRQVYAMVVMLPATHMTPGEVVHEAEGAGGILDAGCFPSGVDECITQVAAALRQADFSAVADPVTMRWKYAKLLLNLTNAVQAAVGLDADATPIMRQVRREALACYAAAGIDCATRDEVAQRHKGVVHSGEVEGHERGGGSSWQSLIRSTGDIEADFLNGEITWLGRLHGVPTPANDCIGHLANYMARNHLAPGHYSIADIECFIEDPASVPSEIGPH